MSVASVTQRVSQIEALTTAPHLVQVLHGDESPKLVTDFDVLLRAGSYISSRTETSVGMSGTIFVELAPSGTPNPSGTGVPLPNTGAGPFTGPFVWLGLAFLVAGGGVLFSLRRRRG